MEPTVLRQAAGLTGKEEFVAISAQAVKQVGFFR